ncbi:MAG: FAD-dependent oxidoreductase [Geobacteraceae bacterium GWC2_53_11]|nr:MAG: FAD-dependent oxidoreductase [Geobacteraceae bacterium GWC2_53_11]
MNPSRAELLERLSDASPWDVIVIGGGATGLGAAVDAASRGYRTLLFEQGDFACGTSSRSTKLIHGGVRYLQQGNLPLVREALRERHILLNNAPHLVHDFPFVIPLYKWWERPFYVIGMTLYDMLSGAHGLKHARHLDRAETVARIPTVMQQNLRGGIVYHDGQFDDARMAVCLARTIADLGGTPLNYMNVTGLSITAGQPATVTAREQESGRIYVLSGRAVINATGVQCDQIRRMDEPSCTPLITTSQGAHIVLDRTFLPGNSAIMIPRTDDGRVFFAIPWYEHVIVGTTDTPLDTITPEPVPLTDEIDFLLAHAGRCLERQPARSDILSCFAGLRPLARGKPGQTTAQLSREYLLDISVSGLVTITGGKWTTYRSMAVAAVDAAALQGGLDVRPSTTRTLRLHGWEPPTAPAGPLEGYGSDRSMLEHITNEHHSWTKRLHSRLPYTTAEVVWAVRYEWARNVEDVLARRTRALFLDAKASREMAPLVAGVMASELGRDQTWQDQQLELFNATVARSLPAGYGRDKEQP